jgi:lipopolysaccharide/colanic/teichoic acid biosynthesis glycosyltransferase
VHRLTRFAVVVGTLGAVGGLSKAHAVAHGYDWSSSPRFAWSLGYSCLLVLMAYGFGLPEQVRSRRSAALAAGGAVVAAAVAVSLVQLVVGDALLPRFVVLGAGVVLVPWYGLCWALARDAESRAVDRDRVIVVAEADEVVALELDLVLAAERAASVVGSLTPDDARTTSMPPSRPLVDVARAERANLVVLSRAAQTDDDVVAQASILHEDGVRVRTLSLFYEQWLGKLPILELERFSLLFDIGELHATTYARVKRAVDVVLAAVGLVVLAVLVPFVFLGNVVANRGPLFFRQSRAGRHGVPFEMLKLRTMWEARELDDVAARAWTSEDDDRITPFGWILRATHLDELPQVVNVLRGELSIVGPRPEQPQVVAELLEKIPFYGVRHLVRPGLTGWAQVKYQYAATEAEALEKLQYEFFYLARQSLALDARIIGRTVRSVLRGEGR